MANDRWKALNAIDQGWSKRIDRLNRERGIDLNAVLEKARRDYHEPSAADRKRLVSAILKGSDEADPKKGSTGGK